jgi:hypothetical protein
MKLPGIWAIVILSFIRTVPPIHGNDMIRFGKYEGSWGFKTDANTYKRIFPIPTAAIAINLAINNRSIYKML